MEAMRVTSKIGIGPNYRGGPWCHASGSHVRIRYRRGATWSEWRNMSISTANTFKRHFANQEFEQETLPDGLHEIEIAQ